MNRLKSLGYDGPSQELIEGMKRYPDEIREGNPLQYEPFEYNSELQEEYLDYRVWLSSTKNRTAGVRLLINAIAEPCLDEVEKLKLDTRGRIFEEWAGYSNGLKSAIAVFDDLCCGYYPSEIARKHNLTRENIRQIHEKLLELPCIQKMKEKLEAMNREKQCELDSSTEGLL